ncbi:hypothetical protein AAIB33_17300 [Microbacterium sp. AZCO]|uniref:hypothetical protein n=1 Tax=Microbacterium sp. AZCO TaxID=3142976 RepID=UPI0031F35FAF
MTAANLTLRAIGDGDVEAVGRFFSTHLDKSIPPERWRAVLAPPWAVSAPNHGYLLEGPDGLAGAYAAVYSEREVDGATVAFCNLAAFCVREEHRPHSLRLIRPLLDQKGYVFTDLSPSGSVVELDRRLGFTALDTSTRLVANVPRLPRRGVRATSDPAVIEATLRGRDAAAYRDHREAPAARHVVVVRGADYAYLVYRRDRRKGLRLFASPLYVGGDRDLLRREWSVVRSHLLLRARLPFTLAERRVLGFAAPLGAELRHPRPKMVRGAAVAPEDVDYLYSELALLEW